MRVCVSHSSPVRSGWHDRAVAKLVVAVTLIALPDSLNPSLVLTELFLAGGPNPRRATAVFAVTSTGTTFVGGVAIALGVRDVILSLLAKPSPTVKDAITVGVGVVLIGGGVLLWIHRDRAASRVDSSRASGRSAALLGIGIAGVELLTAFPYFAAIALVVGSDVSDGKKVALLLLYNLVYALPLIVIAVVCAVTGSRARRLLGPVTDWLMRRWPALVAPVSVAIGIALVGYGGVPLISGHAG
jgi:cytochrome c biogenesis protein CcdA